MLFLDYFFKNYLFLWFLFFSIDNYLGNFFGCNMFFFLLMVMVDLAGFLSIQAYVLKFTARKSSLDDKFYSFPLVYFCLVGLVI